MTIWEKMHSGDLYYPFDEELVKEQTAGSILLCLRKRVYFFDIKCYNVALEGSI